MASWRRALKTPFVASLLWSMLAAASAARQASSAASTDLAAVFDRGVILQDRNGDDVIDFVNARIVLPERPDDGEVAAAANVAARLGFETSAMNLPLRGSASDASVPALVIGARAFSSLGAVLDETPENQPGMGSLTAFSLNGTPGVLISGGDRAGLLAAGDFLAGRLPHAWAMKGPDLKDVEARVLEAVTRSGITGGRAVVSGLAVRSGADQIERLTVSVRLAAPQDVLRARRALMALTVLRRRAGGAEEATISYEGIATVRVRARSGNQVATIDIPRGSTPETRRALGPRPGSSAKEALDLSNLYGIDGLLGDSDSNLIGDRVDALISATGEGSSASVDLAARLGVESTGISVPMAVPPSAIGVPGAQPTLVIIGADHPLIADLVKAHKLELPSAVSGEGVIRIVRKAFGDKSAIVIAGANRAGLERGVSQVAERFPHIWERGKDRRTIGDVADELRRTLGARTPAGQAATAIYKFDQLASELRGKELETADVRFYVKDADPGLRDFLRREVEKSIRAPKIVVSLQDLDVRKGRAIIEEELDIPSEVDDFWTLVRSRVLPAVKKGKAVQLEARLSEPPEVRARLESEVRAAFVRAGANERDLSVTILSAYKQGYSWLNDVVRPALSGTPVDRITIKCAEIGPPPEWRFQGTYAPTRWLLEIYPIDEILARDLGLGVKQVQLEMAAKGSSAYDVTATSAAGAVLFHGTFDPKFVIRPFFDRFPDYEKVRVTTGWITGRVASATVVDQRIVTDVERFWDHFQGQTLPALYDHVMAVAEGKPRADEAPFFGELKVDLTLSEPDYRIGIDEEQISSLEAVHEELYFNTLHFFDVFGRFVRGPALAYPGRVIPIMHPKADGKRGHARITVTAFDVARPSVTIDYRAAGQSEARLRRDVQKIAVDRPMALGAVVNAARSGLDRLELRVKVDTEKDERGELIKRTTEREVDREMLSAAQVRDVLSILGRLRAAGLYRDAMAFPGLRALRVVAAWEHDSNPAAELICDLEPNGMPADAPDIRKLLPSGYGYQGERLVQWATPIPPGEAAEILARMSTFPEAHVYRVGRSYLDQDIWAMDLMPPVSATHWSQFKATTLKPTIVYSARQHANEVSSTSHVLRLGELLLTDPAFKEKLRKVNVVIHPITNPDGAQLAYDLFKVTPDFMLHAGYLGSLGVDVTAAQWDPDPLYPESRVRPDIWRAWLPDIFLNPHGYPSHEWVQLFSEYAAWVRNRVVETRDYWSMRGWWMPYFSYLDDPKYPRHKREQFKIRQLITDRINASPEATSLNARAYDRYRRYTFQWDQRNFKLDFTNGVLMYSAIKGDRADPKAADFMTRQPNITIWDGSTEAPDETARGDWLAKVAAIGLTWDTAVLDYLVEGRHKIDRKTDEFFGGVTMSLSRARPPKDSDDDDEN